MNLTFQRSCLVLAFVIALGGIVTMSTPGRAQDIDLTGEICLEGGVLIDPDDEGPLPAATYCLMLGNLGSDEFGQIGLEMDDTDGLPPVEGDPGSVADANLRATGTANDPNLPDVGVANTYIDWNDLDIGDLTGPDAVPFGSVEDHRILDWTANGDFTMFRPQAASCLNSGSVLPKEDFTQSYIANNNDYLYFGQERRTNNGNSVYYWLLTKEAPTVVTGGECGNNTRGQVQFNLSAGDVELLVNFPSSSDPAGGGVFFRTYVGADSGYVPAKEAVFHPGWMGLAPVENFALNIAEDPHAGDDGFGYWGGVTKQGNPVASGDYTTASFAEWAVDLSQVFPGGGICGQRLFLTGVSRSSTGQVGDLTEPSALKDLIGPKLYSFGDIVVTATATGNCDETFDYAVTALGVGGVPIPENELTCSWSCVDSDTDTFTSSACSGTSTAVAAGAVSCTVTVTETATACTDDGTANTTVLAPIVVSISPSAGPLMCTVPGTPGSDAGNIGGGVTYSATVVGGDGSYSYTWNVLGPGGASCGTDATCLIDIPDGAFCARTEVSVTVDDGALICAAGTSETETVTKETLVSTSDGSLRASGQRRSRGSS